MKRNSISILLAALTISTIFFGCKEKPVTIPQDLENPEIFMSSPEVVELGSYVDFSNLDSIPIDIRFEDDMELATYNINVRQRTDLVFLRTETDPWSANLFGTLEGTVDAVNRYIQVPFDPSAGPYELEVVCDDASGKRTYLTTYIQITNNVDVLAPQIAFFNPNPSAIDTFSIGQTIQIRANITDNDAVKNVTTRVRDAFTDDLMENSTIEYDTLFLQPYLLDTFVTIPAGTVPGMYKVEVYANDPTNNYGYNLDSIYIKPN